MKKLNRIVAMCTLALAPLAPTHALGAIIGTTGAASLISAPPDANLDIVTSTTQVFTWNEDQNRILTTGITLDAVASGFYNSSGLLVASPLLAGTLVSSHYVHFDTPPPNIPATATGTITFDADIIGVIVVGDGSGSATHLDDSDFLGSSTLYPDALDLRGLELSINSDTFGISPNRRILSFSLTASLPGDFLRILTVPAPGAAFPLGAACLCGMVVRRRRTPSSK